MQRLRTAQNYVYNSQTGITSTETTLIKHAKDALDKAFGKTNDFFNNDWKDYKNKMKALKIDPFKDTKTFKID